jgi:glycerol uptake facilitator-like aquaporin
MNPARAIGPGVWEGGAFGWDRFQSDWVVYWIGPILGALAAGGVYYNFLLPEEKVPVVPSSTPALGAKRPS